jgi:hypothetical protein
MPTDRGDDLQALRVRLAKIRGLHAERTAVAEAAGELLSRERTFPHPRKQVEDELRVAVQFDLPMLEAEIGKAEREIAALERQQGPSPEAETEAVTAARPQDEAARARCAAIADALVALAKRAVYVRQLSASSTAEGERSIVATKLALRDCVIQRAPRHDLAVAGDVMLGET